MREVYRILDANFNRAREAIRVVEDYARFVLDDRAAAGTAKSLRGELQAVCAALPAEKLLAARDTPGDVGTTLTSPTETRRDAPSAVALAACKRLTEALRTIEEYAKLVAPDQAAAAERIRYRAYTLEQRLFVGAELRARFRAVRVYLLLTRSLCRLDPMKTLSAAIDGGVECVQVREKHVPDGELLEWCRRIRELSGEAGVLMVVNDRPDLAELCGADGMHLGQDDMPVAAARRIVGPGKLVGLSTHSAEHARVAERDFADYIGVGPMFATQTKDAGPVRGPELLRQVAGEVSLPHVAIGGITVENIGQLIEAGAQRVAVCSAILSAADPAAAARAIREQFPRE